MFTKDPRKLGARLRNEIFWHYSYKDKAKLLAKCVALLDKGADINHCQGAGYNTALIEAVSATGLDDVTSLLIARGADVNLKSGGIPPLFYALSHSAYNNGYRLLVQAGADMQALSSQGDTLLFQALKSGALDIARELVSQGHDLRHVTPYGKTGLYAAVESGDADCVKYVLSQTPDIDVDLAFKDRTALGYAVSNNQLDIIRLLLAQGADPSRRNKKGESVLDAAEGMNKTEILKLLRDHAPKAAPTAEGLGWKVTGEGEIACITEKPALQYRVTEIFNFKARLYTVIHANLATQAESAAVVDFATLARSGKIEAAAAQLAAQGQALPMQALYKPVLKTTRSDMP